MANYPAFGPVHRLGKGILDRWFQNVSPEYRPHIGTRIPADMSDKTPFVLVRAGSLTGFEQATSNDERFMKTARLSIETITTGLDASNDGHDLQESCRLALYDAWREQLVIPDAGSIAAITNTTDIRPVSDWSTSTGVVQYASLPKNAVRYESLCQILFRPPRTPVANQFLPDFYKE